MPTLQEQLQAAVVQTTTDSGLLHTIVHGDATTTVTTEGGPVKSVAKVISENQTLLTTSLATLTTKRDEAVASAAAAAESESAAAASEVAAAASASAADTSAAEALASENAAAASEANAADSEEAAGASKDAAALSESNAADSAAAAALSEANAAASEVAAGLSAAGASSSAGSASSSAVDAAASAAAAAASAAGQLFAEVVDLTHADSPFSVPSTANGYLYRVDTSGGPVEIHLPALAGLALDMRLGVAKATGDVNTVVVHGLGGNTINGLPSRTLAAQYNIDTFVGDKDNEGWFASGGGLGAVNVTVQRFSGDGVQTDFALSGTPGSKNNTNVYISGVYQQKDGYELVGNELVFGEAPPAGTENVEVVFGAQAPLGVPAEDTVGTIHIKEKAVTLAKMAEGTPNKLLGFNGVGAVAEVDAPQAFLPGMLIPFAGSAPPPGWLLCAGQTVSRVAYAALFAVVGTAYGAGDGATTFTLPDLRGRVVAGLDNMEGTSANRLTSAQADVLGGAGGAENQTASGSVGDTTLSEAQLPSHVHQQTWPGEGGNSAPSPMNVFMSGGGNAYGLNHSTNYLGFNLYVQTSAMKWNTVGAGSAASHSHSLSVNPFAVTQPWLAMNYIIKT